MGLILFGTLGFLVLPGLYTGERLGVLDALFMATSAVCVTGLIVVDTATFFTPLGQGYVLLLIQIGGLGMLTFTTLIISALGFRPSLRQEMVVYGSASVAPHVDPRRLTRDVVVFTLAVEAVGAMLLWALWAPELGAAGAVWPAVFHSVSAFCNAGFSTFSDSLVGAAERPALLGVVMALIVLGGIGFLVLEELSLWVRSRGPRRVRISLHSRLVLATTAVLLVGGWGLMTLFEWQRTLEDMPALHRVVNGLFLSVTARTAGFNTIDYADASSSTNFLTILLMSIGGSPGSTAGGLKTTTIALIGLAAWARMRGRPRLELWHRTVPEATQQQAISIFVVAFGLVTAAIFALTFTESGPGAGLVPGTERAGAPADFLTIMFEAVSAFNTVGLSMGATSDLTPAGRALVILLMFAGRVGPLTFAAMLTRRRRADLYHYAHEDVGIG